MIDPYVGQDAPAVATNKTLRQFAGLCLLILGLLACWLYFARDNAHLAVPFAGLAIVLGLLGLVKPQAIRPVFLGAMALTFPIGWVVSRLLLALLYYGVFTPTGLLFRLIGRDALSRRYRSDLTSYWAAKPAARDVRSYFRQF